MTRVNNLWDLHKKRDLFISRDNKRLIVDYEGFSPSFLKEYLQRCESKFRIETIFGDASISLNDRSLFHAEIVTEKPSLDDLWRVAMILAYFLGDGVMVYVHSDEIPHYPIPRGLNLGGGGDSYFARSTFARDPKHAIEAGFDLLNDEISLFRQLLVPMLQINTIPFFDIRFLGEFVLLEQLSKNQISSSFIVNDEKTLLQLQTILDSAQKAVSESVIFSEEHKQLLQRKLKLDVINTKASTKDRMYSFIESLGSEFREYAEDVRTWNMLRNKGIAHGASLASKIDMNDVDTRCMKRLHNLLCMLIYRDFQRQVNTVIKTETPAL